MIVFMSENSKLDFYFSDFCRIIKRRLVHLTYGAKVFVTYKFIFSFILLFYNIMIQLIIVTKSTDINVLQIKMSKLRMVLCQRFFVIVSLLTKTSLVQSSCEFLWVVVVFVFLTGRSFWLPNHQHKPFLQQFAKSFPPVAFVDNFENFFFRHDIYILLFEKTNYAFRVMAGCQIRPEQYVFFIVIGLNKWHQACFNTMF